MISQEAALHSLSKMCSLYLFQTSTVPVSGSYWQILWVILPRQLGVSGWIWLLSVHSWAKGGALKGQIVLGEAFSYDSAGQEWASFHKTLEQNNVITVKGGLQSKLRLSALLHFQVKRAAAFKRRRDKGAKRKCGRRGWGELKHKTERGSLGQRSKCTQSIIETTGCFFQLAKVKVRVKVWQANWL